MAIATGPKIAEPRTSPAEVLAQAKDLGVTIEIGPDAHSTGSLDNVHFGIGMARKGWLTTGDILNARSAEEVLEFARARRSGR